MPDMRPFKDMTYEEATSDEFRREAATFSRTDDGGLAITVRLSGEIRLSAEELANMNARSPRAVTEAFAGMLDLDLAEALAALRVRMEKQGLQF